MHKFVSAVFNSIDRVVVVIYVQNLGKLSFFLIIFLINDFKIIKVDVVSIRPK